MSKFANMKARKDTVKKFVGGGALIQAGLGAAQTAYGITQLPKARAEFERAKAAAPSLETPAQYYQNYKNAYDSELARMESESIQTNLSTSVQALQGAGGRALVGGLGASVAQSQSARNAMMQQERAARLQAGQTLAQAEESAISRKEVRSQQDISYANQAYQAALGNIGSGIGAIGEAGMYGAFDGVGSSIEKFMQNGLSPNMSKFAQNQSDIDQRLQQLSMEQSAKIRSNFSPTSDIDLTSSLKKPAMPTLLDSDFEHRSSMDREYQRAQEREKASEASYSSGASGPGYSMFNDRLSKFKNVGATENFDPSTLKENERYLNIGGQTFVAPKSGIDAKAMSFMKNLAPKAIANALPILAPLRPYVNNPKMAANMLVGMSMKEQGGMMTNGPFSHSSNPIDIVQNGQKVAEATGNEYILNPAQAKKISAESGYAKKLFKRFEKQAKKKK